MPQAHFSFASSDSSILAVRGDTLVALRLGTATVTASVASSLVGGAPPSVSQSVQVVPLAVIADSASVTFHSIGDTLTMGVRVLAADSSPVANAPVTWTSLDTNRVSVTPQGRLLARSRGTIGVVVSAGTKADTVSATVTQTLVHFTFAAPVVTFNALTAVQTVAATPRDARGNAITSGVAPTYSTLDASIATVNAVTGAVTSAFNGGTWLVAASGTVRDSVQVIIAQKAKLIAISPKPVPVITSINDSRQLSASAVDSLAVPIAAAQPIWIPLSATVYSVSQTGLVTALTTGSAYVVATLDGRRDSVLITVTNDPGSIKTQPDTATATSLGDTLIFTAIVRNLRGDSIGMVPTWRLLDTTVGRSLGDGRVIALKVGSTRLIAQAGARTDTSFLVVTNIPATVAFSLHGKSLTALADVDTPAVSLLNARGATLDRSAVQWTSDDPTIARVNARGIVTAVDTGQTIVRACYPVSCLLQDTVIYTVQNVPTLVAIVLPARGTSGAGSKRDTLTAIGQALPLGLVVLNHRAAPIVNYPVVWSSTNQAIVDSVRRDTAVALGLGTTKLIATAGTVADTLTLVVANLTRIIVDNSVVANPRVGTLSRPFLRIQDGVNAADANDTVVVRKGSSAYSETVALSKRLFLLGDSTTFVLGGRTNPTALPFIGHDTGTAAITAFTSAPQTIKFLTIRHTLDGAALDANGSDVTVDNVYVNPSGLTTTRIGRGLSIKNSVSGTRITNTTVDSVRGYGVRLEAVSNAIVHIVTVIGVDSLPGLEEGAGIKLVSGNADAVSINFVRNTQIGVLVTGATSARVDTNTVWRNLNGLRITGGTTSQALVNDIYDNTADTIPLGVVNPGGGTVTVTNTFWGDSLGPRQSSTPLATGDSVVGSVTVAGTVRSRPLFAGSVAAALRIVRGNNQSRSAGNPLNQAFAVRVVDASGLPTSGVSVTFTTASGGNFGGQPSATVISNGAGLAETTYTTSSTKGLNTVTATITVNSLPVSVTFSATGT